jgi:hypothetical protein
LATPNYSFEKRQRELAKKRKKEEKLQRKAAGKPDGAGGESEPDEAAPQAGTPGDAAAAPRGD